MATSKQLVVLVACAAAAHANAYANNVGYSRWYIHSWNVGLQCNKDPACRAAALKYTTATQTMTFSPLGMMALVTIWPGSAAVELPPLGLFKGKNYTQVSGHCGGDDKNATGESGVGVTFYPGVTIERHGGGCLNHPTGEAHAFAVAFVQPPPPHELMGGTVKGCAAGICVVGLHAPPGEMQTPAAVSDVCGETKAECTIGVGDWNEGAGARSITNRWTSLLGAPPKAKLWTDTAHVAHANVVTNIPGVSRAMTVHEGSPMAKQFGNLTGLNEALVVDVLLPCQHPGPFASDGCKPTVPAPAFRWTIDGRD